MGVNTYIEDDSFDSNTLNMPNFGMMNNFDQSFFLIWSFFVFKFFEFYYKNEYDRDWFI